MATLGTRGFKACTAALVLAALCSGQALAASRQLWQELDAPAPAPAPSAYAQVANFQQMVTTTCQGPNGITTTTGPAGQPSPYSGQPGVTCTQSSAGGGLTPFGGAAMGTVNNNNNAGGGLTPFGGAATGTVNNNNNAGGTITNDNTGMAAGLGATVNNNNNGATMPGTTQTNNNNNGGWPSLFPGLFAG